MVGGGDQAGVKVDNPDSNAWDKPATSNRNLKGEKQQYADFCNQFRMLGTVPRRPKTGIIQLRYVLAALQVHDPRWTEELLRRVVAAWNGASAMKDFPERIAELCKIAVERAVPGDKATYTGADGPKWPKTKHGSKPLPDDTLRVGPFWDNMKKANKRFKEFAAAMAAHGWSPEQVHALVEANRSKARRGKFPLKE